MTIENPKRFANMTGWFIRYVNVYKLFKEKELNGNEAMLTENEFNNIVINIATGNNDDLFEEYAEEFRSISIR